MPQLVFLDANVIFSRVLRDWVLMLCASTRGEIFTLATSEDVLAEAVARLRDRYPAAPSGLVENLRDKVRDYVDEMVTGYPGGEVAWIADEGDWHVHHAALHCGAQILLTQDAGFASDETPYEAQSCNQLFCRIDDAAPAAVREVVAMQARHWAAKSGSRQLPDVLRAADCPAFADRVQSHLRGLALRR